MQAAQQCGKQDSLTMCWGEMEGKRMVGKWGQNNDKITEKRQKYVGNFLKEPRRLCATGQTDGPGQRWMHH